LAGGVRVCAPAGWHNQTRAALAINRTRIDLMKHLLVTRCRIVEQDPLRARRDGRS
jgi:hypothetical protein